jgi:HAD superfamily hydrolase (TIGR01509 family)
MIKAFIFDLDGTLVDSEVIYLEAIGQVLNEAGYPLAEDELLEIVYGHGWGEVFESMHARCPGLTRDDQALASAIMARYSALEAIRDICIPGSVALLKRLARQHPVCIVSGSYRAGIAEAIERMDAAAEIAFYIGAEEYAHGKPNPLCFLLAADRLDLEPAECLVFEDSTAGVRAAKAAGMPCVALARPGRPEQDHTGADLVLTDLSSFNLETFNA